MSAPLAPLGLLPGWALGRAPWHATAADCVGVVRDLAGYRATTYEAVFDRAVAQLAADLAPGTVLCGWSLGAMVALACAARFPDKVSRLVLVAGTASFVQRPDWPHAMPPADLASFAQAMAADSAAMLPRFIGGFNRGDALEGPRKALTRRLLERADPLPAREVLARGLDWLRDTDLRTLAPTVRVPTLLVHGDHDPLMPLPAAQALTDLIPGARLEVFAHAAHAVFLAAPERFHSLLQQFRHEPPL